MIDDVRNILAACAESRRLERARWQPLLAAAKALANAVDGGSFTVAYQELGDLEKAIEAVEEDT